MCAVRSPKIRKEEFMRKIPWGILAGICAIVVFFATIGTVAAFIVLNSIAGQTNTTATMFDEWWQTLLFVADIVFVLGFAGSLTMYILGVVRTRREKE